MCLHAKIFKNKCANFVSGYLKLNELSSIKKFIDENH